MTEQKLKSNVLIVDDMEGSRNVMELMFRPYKVHITLASSGIEAVDLVKQGHMYQLILMDFMMPGMDGVEATRLIRSMGYPNTIVALTGNEEEGQEELFLHAGFDEYITKPINSKRLRELVSKYISVVDPIKQDSICIEERLRTDANFAQVMLRDFKRVLQVLEEYITDIREGKSKELTQVGISTHGVKSSLRTLEMFDLSEEAKQLEDACKCGDESYVQEHLPGFIERLREVVYRYEPSAADAEEVDQDSTHLLEQLRLIKEACESYDKKMAKQALANLRNMKWSKHTNDLLDSISSNLLSGDFEAIDEDISRHI